jgi:hypothetical protein
VGRAPLPHLIALLCGFLAAAAVGCGDRSNLIPAQRASDLTSQLDAIKSAIDAGRCDGLSARVKAFHDDATSLDPAVDRRLRTRLREGANSLQDNAVDDCQAAAAEQTQTQTTDTTPETTPTETVPTTTTPTTVQTETTPTAPPETTTAPPSTATPPSDQTPTTADGGGTGGDTGGTPGAEQTP